MKEYDTGQELPFLVYCCGDTIMLLQIVGRVANSSH